jgi:hypothetical protein
MFDKTITAFFDSYADASDAVRRLESAGIAHSDISLVASNQGSHPLDRTERSFAADDGVSDRGDTRAEDGAGLLGGLSVLAIPGLGPVVGAGWLISPLVGTGAGAATGGLVGTLVDAGVPEQDARAYEEGVRRGGSLVAVRARENEADRIVDLLDDERTVDFEDRQNVWRSEGWLPGHGDAIGAAASTTTGLTTGSMGVPIGAMGALGPAEIVSDRTDADAATSDETMSFDSDSSAMSRGSMEPGPAVAKAEEGRGKVRIHAPGARDSGRRSESVADAARRTEVEVYDERGRRITRRNPNRDRT